MKNYRRKFYNQKREFFPIKSVLRHNQKKPRKNLTLNNIWSTNIRLYWPEDFGDNSQFFDYIYKDLKYLKQNGLSKPGNLWFHTVTIPNDKYITIIPKKVGMRFVGFNCYIEDEDDFC